MSAWLIFNGLYGVCVCVYVCCSSSSSSWYRFRCNYKRVLQSRCNTCTLAFGSPHRFIRVVKISCGRYVFVIFFHSLHSFLFLLFLFQRFFSPHTRCVVCIPILFTFQRMPSTASICWMLFLFFNPSLFRSFFPALLALEATKML